MRFGISNFGKISLGSGLCRFVYAAVCIIVCGWGEICAAQERKDPCAELANNTEWIEGIKSVADDYTAGNYKAALKTAKRLSDTICADSPTLLYTEGKIYEAMDDKKRALLHYQKASEATKRYATSEDMAQKIWYARYENEHPDRTEKAVEEKAKKIAELENELNESKAQNNKLSNELSNVSSELESQQMAQIQNAKAWMWSGVGIGIAGIAMLGAGAGLVVANNDKPADVNIDYGTQIQGNFKVKNSYVAGWALIGVGTALIAVGGVLSGYFGYQFTHSKQDNDISFSILPTGASFKMTF